MNARIACYAAVLLSGTLLASGARAECNCLYNGQRYEQEDTVCMRTPQGTRMARCGMLDNIAWWEMLDDPCPGTVSDRRQSLRPSLAANPDPLGGLVGQAEHRLRGVEAR